MLKVICVPLKYNATLHIKMLASDSVMTACCKVNSSQ